MLAIIFLGFIQGVGEFLPISSSAHLILIPYLFDLDLSSFVNDKLAFDLALHFGTLMAVMFVFYKDILNMINGVYRKIIKKEDSFDNKIFWYLVVATIPGALAGFLFEDTIDLLVRSNYLLIAIFLGVMGILLYMADKYASKKYKDEITFEKISFKNAFIIGFSQAFALLPGFSRSGTTILTGRLLGLSREAAAKYTFLLSIPIIMGATILKIGDLNFTFEVVIGIITSFVVGVLTIKFLLKYIREKGFYIFAYYRVIIALIVIIKVLFI